jgi:methylmalonyl-CoA mutase C-terminal domain/subunit
MVFARALRDAGMDVIFSGLSLSRLLMALAAVQEDVDVVGLSILSGAHMALAPRIVELLRANDLGEVPLFIGGIVPNDDIPALKAMGVTAVFGPGTNTETIVEQIRESVRGVRAG